MAIDDNTSYELTGYQVKDLAQKIRAKADSSSLASVATSGLYSDLTGAPTIPTVYNGTLTIQHNGTSAGTFTANASSDKTINIETIYADTPGTATTPAASVQASDIVWSTMPFNYSTTEVDTGCTWIDGSHIYRKTVGPFSIAIGDIDVAHNISGIDLVIDATVRQINSTGSTVFISAAANTSGGNYMTLWTVNRTNMHFFSSVNLTGSVYATIWYTKSS